LMMEIAGCRQCGCKTKIYILSSFPESIPPAGKGLAKHVSF
jgi:hypothetical protein